MSLVEEGRALLERAAALTTETPELHERAGAAIDRLAEPLRVAVAGRVKAGKSTLVNAMVGELIAPTDARECTKIVTWYRDGVTYRVEGVDDAGEATQLRFDRNDGALEIDLGGRSPDQLARIDVTWPSAHLREMTLVDTPGIDSINTEVSARTEDFLTGGDDRPTPTDAVLYLLRHVHTGDLRFLEAFHDADMAAANPVNSIGVLSRADEIGATRPDALTSARRIAERWRSDPRLARLVQTVVPVAGLVAEGATTLRQAEHAAFATLGAADPATVDELLVSADRFANSEVTVGVTDIERRQLLERFGLFGCRLAVALVRGGEHPTASSLANGLRDASGVPMLRSEIATRLSQRRDLLKARHAFATAHAVAAAIDDRSLLADVERVVLGAHEFSELRVINALRRGDIEMPEQRRAAALRLLGADGMSATDRVGLDAQASTEEVRAALVEQLGRWRQRAEHPLSSRPVVDASLVIARTCEGLLAASATDAVAASEVGSLERA